MLTSTPSEDASETNLLCKLTEIHPSQRGECFKAPCQCSGWMKTQVNNQTKIAGQDELTITQ